MGVAANLLGEHCALSNEMEMFSVPSSGEGM